MIKSLIPTSMIQRFRPAWRNFRRNRIRTYQRAANTLGLNLAKKRDYYSVLPVLEQLYRNEKRWNRPSGLVGVDFDFDAMRNLLEELVRDHAGPMLPRARYDEIASHGFGPGYPRTDAILSYSMLRRIKPRRYIEVGSGLSTYIAHLAGEDNARDHGRPMEITCVEPFPNQTLRAMKGVNLVVDMVQNVSPDVFSVLEAGDVLFIDSTHVVAIDSDVTYLFMEIVPRVKPGVWIHIHDIPFPFNSPYPASTWVLGDRWPVFWQEAMLVQAFLAFNSKFRTRLSVPMLRHQDESLLTRLLPDYLPVAKDENPPSALWIERVD